MEGSRARRERPWDTGVKVTQGCLTGEGAGATESQVPPVERLYEGCHLS